jgi:hypothetical protein
MNKFLRKSCKCGKEGKEFENVGKYCRRLAGEVAQNRRVFKVSYNFVRYATKRQNTFSWAVIGRRKLWR